MANGITPSHPECLIIEAVIQAQALSRHGGPTGRGEAPPEDRLRPATHDFADATARRTYAGSGGLRLDGVCLGSHCEKEAEMDPHIAEQPTATAGQFARLLVSLELSRRSWLLTVQPPDRAKPLQMTVAAHDTARLLAVLTAQQAKAADRLGGPVRIVSIQEAGLDGFWLHRWLEAQGIESHVVDPASILGSRRKRQAKTDRIDGIKLLDSLADWLAGRRQRCAMVVAPSPEQEDRRRLTRERGELIAERTRLSNRIGGLLASQGIIGFQPRAKAACAGLAELRTGDGRALMPYARATIERILARIALLEAQIKAVDQACEALLALPAALPAAALPAAAPDGDVPEDSVPRDGVPRDSVPRDSVLGDGVPRSDPPPASPPPGAPSMEQALFRLRGIGLVGATVLPAECLYKPFDNASQVGAFAGLTPTPYASGGTDREQGISKAGNRRLRALAIELAWAWIRYQPDSALTRWFRAKVKGQGNRARRVAIVALARRLLEALWRYVRHGVVPEGAVFKS